MQTLADDGSLSVSPARWLGVALVLGALVTAMTMAATSSSTREREPAGPADLGAAAAPATPPAVVPGEGVPAELPEIVIKSETVSDASGALVTRDPEAMLSVTVPETDIRNKQLTLEILRDRQLVQEIDRPGETVEARPVELREGRNLLAARLRGPGGTGPAFEVPIELDTRPPALRVTTPRENHSAKDESITVRGQSEPGARLVLINRRTDAESPQTVGPSGSWDEIVFLEPGENVIRVKAMDIAGNVSDVERTVEREGADVRAEISVQPRRLAARSLPGVVRIMARLVDGRDRPVEDVQVTFTLSVPGQPTRSSGRIPTGPDGVASWRPQVGPEGIERGAALITLDGKLPTGGKVTADSDGLTIE